MATPVQKQYFELKNQNPDAILFFRLGDFYEMFYEDALLCSRVLGITLTARHRGTENEMPMCGVPYHSSEEYLKKLLDAGYKIAIAEQEEDPETKNILRKIVRVLTPGTVLEEAQIAPDRPSYLATIFCEKKIFSLTLADITTGEFRTALFHKEESFYDELYKANPREILLPPSLFSDELFCKKLPRSHITPRPEISVSEAEDFLKNHFGVSHLEIFGIHGLSLLLKGSAMTLSYLKETLRADISHITKIIRYRPDDFMELDDLTFRHLEIFEPLYRDEKAVPLWSLFEKCFTAMGSRTLRGWVSSPLLSYHRILERQEAISYLFEKFDFQEKLRTILPSIFDLERILSRIVVGKTNARDFVFFRESFSVFPELFELFSFSENVFFRERAILFKGFESLFEHLQKSLVDNPPLEITEGGMFREGIESELDELRYISRTSEEWLSEFLDQKKKESGISNLRFKFSNTFGYCLEVSSGQLDKVPSSWNRRQTLVNAERFTTPELSSFEEKILSAKSRIAEIEYRLFQDLRKEFLEFVPQIQDVSRALGEVDAVMSLFRTAQKYRWTKPILLEKSSLFEVSEGRHPVVEKISSTFISNDLFMNEENHLHIITGPNMGGKSTFLRQNALIIFLAQIGSFVPAKSVTMGLFDRIFTRVGASDNLSGGKSTFFVEMSETARILHAATDRSFVILDEIGRGTSTFDGISLAWAITEFLHDTIRAKVLFATHFHELIDLAEVLPRARNYHVSVAQGEKGIVFLYRISEGGISDSFGIEVAERAGLPKKVILCAKNVLRKIEEENLVPSIPTLFSIPRVREKIVEVSRCSSEIEEVLEKLDLESISPREAWQTLFDLQKKKKSS